MLYAKLKPHVYLVPGIRDSNGRRAHLLHNIKNWFPCGCQSEQVCIIPHHTVFALLQVYPLIVIEYHLHKQLFHSKSLECDRQQMLFSDFALMIRIITKECLSTARSFNTFNHIEMISHI